VLFGAHCSGGIKKALDKGVEMGAEAVQLFVQSPRTWRFPNHDPAELERFRERRKETGLPALVHALYLVNLAAPDEAVYGKSVETMRSTVDAACAIDAEAVVFHVGSHLGAGFEAGLERVVPALAQVLDRCTERTWLLMENSAGAGGTIGRSVDELAVIFAALDRHERLGVCLDSCHLFASGIEITDPAAMTALLDELDAKIGLDRLRALHLNDSQVPFGSNRDRHAPVGEGLIGDGLAAFLGHPRLQRLPCVLETPSEESKTIDAGCLAAARRLHEAGLARYS
jgi:deoxyribonuclease IV